MEVLILQIYIVDPILTTDCKNYEDIFEKRLKEELDKYGINNKVIYKTNYKLLKNEIHSNDLIIVFNGNDKFIKYKELEDLILKAQKLDVKFWPIAMTKKVREPLKIINKIQSYDVEEQLRCRDFGNDYLSVIATIFARKIISMSKFNIYNENGTIFISHRRIDGEEITANLCDILLNQYKKSNYFRDVTNVEVGFEAQDEIDNAMAKSDAFVFLQTPKASDSLWIMKELRFAIIRKIPVVWIQINNAKKELLPFTPSEFPHLSFKSKDFKNKSKLREISDKIAEKTFELIMEKNSEIYDYISKIEEFKEVEKININIDKMICTISAERKNYKYYHRKINHIVQFFGRIITDNDIEELKKIAQNHCENNFDSIILLTNKILNTKKLDCKIIIENYNDFFDTWNKYLYKDIQRGNEKEIIISGAFPDSEEIYKQTLNDALIIFTKEILKDSYTLTFGSHPTFQELFFDISKNVFSEKNNNKLKMFISKYFNDEYNNKVTYFKNNASLNEVENVNDNMLSSLSLMRREMIQRENVATLVCIGGKRK